jgi:hypothetical protein
MVHGRSLLALMRNVTGNCRLLLGPTLTLRGTSILTAPLVLSFWKRKLADTSNRTGRSE